MVRTRSAALASPAPFMRVVASNNDLLDQILAALPKDDLACLALASKALSLQVQERALEPAFWKEDSEVAGAASKLWRISHRSEEFEAAKVRLVSLLEEQDALGYKRLVRDIASATSAVSVHTIKSRIQSLQADAMSHLVSACTLTMEPAQLIHFAQSLTTAAHEPHFPKPPQPSTTAMQWASLWRDAIEHSLRRKEWTPALIEQLVRACPYRDQEVHTVLLSALSLNIASLRTFVLAESTDAVVGATLVSQYVNRRHFQLLDGEPDDVTYDDDRIEALWGGALSR